MMKTKLNSRLISEIGVKEKYIRKEHFNSIKVWWARRPITAMRNLLVQEILKKSLCTKEEVAYELITELNPNNSIFQSFASKYKTEDISVLDIFSGGGSIPFESSRLGCNTFSSELNPIAALAQETVFKSLDIANFSNILKKEGLKVISEMEKEYLCLYKFEDNYPYVFFWSRTMKCEKCGLTFNLGRIKYFSKRKNNIKYMHDGVIDNNDIKSTEKEDKGFRCTHCNYDHSFSDIKKYCQSNSLGDSLLAVCKYNDKKEYLLNTPDANHNLAHLDNILKDKLEKMNASDIDWQVSSRGGVINPTLYDLKYAGNFYNKRQHIVILGLIDSISDNYKEWLIKYSENTAKQLVYALTSLIEFLVDWNNKGTMWISQNEQTGRSLAGPGVGMKWDYIEINPFFSKGSNLKSKLLRVCDSFNAIAHKSNVTVMQGSSTNIELPSESIDIILTDPPYYDSIEYTALSEFFRPWFELLLKNTCNKTIYLKNDESKEAIVELHKNSKLKKDSKHYQTLMTNVLKEANRVLKPNGTCLMLYSHKTFEGWEVIANAIHDAGLYITNCYPIEMERIARPRAMAYDALNGVIVFRMSKCSDNISSTTTDVNNICVQLDCKEILDSHIVIYLASLACKELCINGGKFNDVYKNIIAQYESIQLQRWDNDKMDNLSKIYLLSRISINSLTLRDINILRDSNLLKSETSCSPLSIMEINKKEIDDNSILNNAIDLFTEFKTNSKTKIAPEKMSDELLFFISCISGLSLNTIRHRSSDSEAKIARLILSKFSGE